MDWLKEISYIVNTLLITFVIVGIITYIWQNLELIYLGYVNDNPVDTIVTILYSIFVFESVNRWVRR